MDQKDTFQALVPACRVFFDEFLKSDFFVLEQGKRVLVTPTGARCARFYGVGELEGEETRGKIVRVTVNDSTASLHIYTSRGTPLGTSIPTNLAEKGTLIAFYGNVHLSEDAGKRKRAFILAEELRAVEELVRTNWILSTAERTLERIERVRVSLSSGRDRKGKEVDLDRLKETIEHYALDDDKLDAFASMAINAVKSLWLQYRETTREMIAELLKRAGKSGMNRDAIMNALKTKGLPETWINEMIDELIIEGKCYELVSGVLTC